MHNTQLKKLVVLTGAGISAESGIPTFRDAGGLWEGYKVEDVATPGAWQKNPSLVLDFYNERRKQAISAKPNQGHLTLVELEKYFDVRVITQNIDNLHERAGSTKVLHLHGSIFQSRSSVDPGLIYPINGWQMKMGECCEKGSQLRPNIVWFGEIVYALEEAATLAAQADIFLVVGTSMQVYPAAGLIHYVANEIPKFVVDPGTPELQGLSEITVINQKASTGMPLLKELLLSKYHNSN
jgi:NAD-dependent deacetylase